MKTTNPATMSPAERVAEIGEILAAGYQRLLVADGKGDPAGSSEANSRADQLALTAVAEAQCAAMSTEATP